MKRAGAFAYHYGQLRIRAQLVSFGDREHRAKQIVAFAARAGAKRSRKRLCVREDFMERILFAIEQDQLFLRARHGDIKDTRLLLKTLARVFR